MIDFTGTAEEVIRAKVRGLADVERGKAGGEFAADTDPELLIDTIFSPIFFRLLLRYAPLTQRYGDELVDQVLRGVRLQFLQR